MISQKQKPFLRVVILKSEKTLTRWESLDNIHLAA